MIRYMQQKQQQQRQQRQQHQNLVWQFIQLNIPRLGMFLSTHILLTLGSYKRHFLSILRTVGSYKRHFLSIFRTVGSKDV